MTESNSGDQNGFDRLVEEYVGILPDRVTALKTALQTNDLKTAEEIAEQMAGAAGLHGFDELSEWAGLLMHAISERQEPSLRNDLLAEWEGTVQAIVERHGPEEQA